MIFGLANILAEHMTAGNPYSESARIWDCYESCNNGAAHLNPDTRPFVGMPRHVCEQGCIRIVRTTGPVPAIRPVAWLR